LLILSHSLSLAHFFLLSFSHFLFHSLSHSLPLFMKG
jgi:hypothetical protein